MRRMLDQFAPWLRVYIVNDPIEARSGGSEATETKTSDPDEAGTSKNLKADGEAGRREDALPTPNGDSGDLAAETLPARS